MIPHEVACGGLADGSQSGLSTKGTRISDYVTLGVLTGTVPGDLIDAVLSDTGKQSRRYRQLPARLVVYYVMALVLFAQASYGEVLRCLLEGPLAAPEGRARRWPASRRSPRRASGSASRR